MPGRSLPKILTRRVGTSGVCEAEVCEALMVSPPYPAPSAFRRRGPPDGHGTMGVDPVSRILPPENGTAPARAIPPGSTTRVPRPRRNGRRRHRRHGRLSGAGVVRGVLGPLVGVVFGGLSWRTGGGVRGGWAGVREWCAGWLGRISVWCVPGPCRCLGRSCALASCVLDRTGVLASCVLKPGGAVPCVCCSRAAPLASCVLWPGRRSDPHVRPALAGALA